jgi:hypothetical protein
MSDIPVVTQQTQQGEFLWNQLQLLFVSNRLTLWPYPYFIYLIHTDASAFIVINNPFKIPPSTGILAPNGGIMTMTPLSNAAMGPTVPQDAPALAHANNNLIRDVEQPSAPTTVHQRAVITHVMETVWGISSPRHFQVEALLGYF